MIAGRKLSWAGLALLGAIGLTCGIGAGQATAPAGQEFPQPVFDSLQTAFVVYEDVRSDLAADKLEPVSTRTLRLVGALRLALKDQAGLQDPVPGLIEEAAVAAEEMGDAQDLAAARIAFGEVSHRLMLLANRDPRLIEGWHVFACPMAEKFQKWMQPKEELENPYMGPGMLRCGTSSDWVVPELASASGKASGADAEVADSSPKAPEPEFKPGIPDLQMVDVRDHKFLWREIDQLQVWERGERLTIAEFRSKAIEKTAHYLQLSGSSVDEFSAAAYKAVAEVQNAFQRQRETRKGFSYYGKNDKYGSNDQFASDLKAAAKSVTSTLKGEPRHKLFEPGCQKWLLKLAFGPNARKEAKEAQEAKEAKQAKPDTSGK